MDDVTLARVVLCVIIISYLLFAVALTMALRLRKDDRQAIKWLEDDKANLIKNRDQYTGWWRARQEDMWDAQKRVKELEQELEDMHKMYELRLANRNYKKGACE